jgi:FtsP/CotA-like multicopper oxidase with cupredoxin domain
MSISRRRLLGTALAAGVLPAAVRAAAAGPQRLVAETRTLEVNGRAARVFGLIGPDGRPGIRLAPGERFRVDLANQTGVRTLVHWHGQLPPWTQDGFPWPQTPPIANGATQAYDYAPVAGTYWMHSHHDLQEQSLLAAPLIVHDAAAPQEDRQEVVLLLHDFTFRTPDEVLAGLTGTSPAAVHAMAERDEAGRGRNSASDAPQPGMGGMTAMADHDMPRTAMQGTAMGGTTMPGTTAPEMSKTGMGMSGMASSGMTMSGQAKAGMAGSGPVNMRMDLNDVHYDAFLANDRTLVDPEIVRVERGGQIRLRVINAASASQFWIDLGALTGRVVATDGHPVEPLAGRRFPLAMAQRLDILIDVPGAGAFPILARLEGSVRQTGIVVATPDARIRRIADAAHAAPPLDNSLEMRLAAAEPLPARPADVVHTIALAGSMQPYAWSMNGEYWPRITPLMVSQGQRVEIELVNPSMMAHPMHLHGHTFQVVAIDGHPIHGAVRDTVLVTPMMGRVRIAFDANNPGRWAFHCHNLYHMQTGMMTEFRYQGIAA